MDKSVKKTKARDEFRAYAEKSLGVAFGKLQNKQISHALLRFYIFEIHNQLRSEISEEDFVDGVVDNSGDLDIDFIHRDDGHVLIVQGRYHGDGVKEKPQDVGHFQEVLTRITSGDFKPNNRLADILSSLNLEEDTFSLVYLTFGEIAGQASDQTKQRPHMPENIPGIAERCDWEYLDEKALDAELRKARSVAASIDDTWWELHSVGPKGKRSVDGHPELTHFGR